jgi:hypothetical protein
MRLLEKVILSLPKCRRQFLLVIGGHRWELREEDGRWLVFLVTWSLVATSILLTDVQSAEANDQA